MYLFPRWKETISGTRKKRYVVTWDPLPLPITLHNKIHYPPSALGSKGGMFHGMLREREVNEKNKWHKLVLKRILSYEEAKTTDWNQWWFRLVIIEQAFLEIRIPIQWVFVFIFVFRRDRNVNKAPQLFCYPCHHTSCFVF